eukprot:1322864-Amorphochlora_amoeboformis.AAC.1
MRRTEASQGHRHVGVIQQENQYQFIHETGKLLIHKKNSDEPPEAKIERKTGGPVHVFNWANFVKYGDENVRPLT